MKLLTCCWSRQKGVSPALPSVPGEVLRDILLPLNRWTLDDVQFTCRRFLRLITERMSDVCLRRVTNATFNASHRYYVHSPKGPSFFIYANDERRIEKAHKDMALLFSQFVQALRSSRVHFLELNGLVSTPELTALVLRTPIVASYLTLSGGSYAELTPAEFHKLVLHFSPTELLLGTCPLRASHVTVEFIRMLSKKRVLCSSFPYVSPVDGDSFYVTDDAVVEFCAQQDVQVLQEREQLEELTLCRGRFTKDLFKRLVEASSASNRTRPLGMEVSPVHFEDEDLREYAQHLTYRDSHCVAGAHLRLHLQAARISHHNAPAHCAEGHSAQIDPCSAGRLRFY
ncbi:hypothetical protein AAVH_42290 [Aphelenchoides avenae]|nr:hypothetical protein AAVH_42290 [Aphelenchus avenae]